jgi:hypothetical protein
MAEAQAPPTLHPGATLAHTALRIQQQQQQTTSPPLRTTTMTDQNLAPTAIEHNRDNTAHLYTTRQQTNRHKTSTHILPQPTQRDLLTTTAQIAACRVPRHGAQPSQPHTTHTEAKAACNRAICDCTQSLYYLSTPQLPGPCST